MGTDLQRRGTVGRSVLGRGLAALHALLQARATAAHPWLFTATATAATAGALMAEAARNARTGRGAS